MSDIKSPLAKINKSNGSITCILCNAPVSSSKFWVAHVNGRQHRQKAAELKAKKSQSTESPKISSSATSKRPALSQPQPRGTNSNPVQESATKKPRLESNSGPLPSDFFDSSQKPSVAISDLKLETQKKRPTNSVESLDRKSLEAAVTKSTDSELPTSSEITPWEKELRDKQSATEVKPPEPNTAEALPEGFFDDKQKDAKIRKVELKDEMEEEWVKFQKEIKVAEQMSNAIIEEEEEAMTTEREIEEIDKQIEEWTRVNELEKKKDEVEQLRRKMTEETERSEQMEVAEDEEEEIDLDSILDWRSKGIK